MNSAPGQSLENLLTSGGDTRLDIDPKTGRNRYACGARPGNAVPFGSCTSSTISPRGFSAAERASEQILIAANPELAANDLAITIRQRLGELLTLPEGVDIALAPSGTDVEMLALALAAGNDRRPIVNILVGPSEVGSGTPLASAGCHYDGQTPSGARVEIGQPVDRALAAGVDVRTVDLRSSRGDMLSESEIDAAVIELFIEASEADAIVLLHVVAHSKTGVHAPSLSCVERLRKISDDVAVVVDAAQGRFSRRGLRDALKNEYLVIFTGSKFYGGPPFCGALLVPPRSHPERRGLNALPAGFRDYFSAAELPETWTNIRHSLPNEPNTGLLLRWSAAIAEIESYYKVPNDLRLSVLRFFEAEAPKILGESKVIRMLPVFPPLYDDSTHRLLESKTTVFGFWITPPGARQPLGKSELKQLHFDLTSDLSKTCDAADRKMMSQQFHVGQPVDLGHAGFILRVALGGELITRVATDTNIGKSIDDRLDWLRGQLLGLRQKIECLAMRHASTTAQTTRSAVVATHNS
ncbi:MAG TPA: hypothetical protein VFW73_12510 [Lacipirellulaceae bacterium]|nr:hypothetical protein [Lacipirellulaceae bacterium]